MKLKSAALFLLVVLTFSLNAQATKKCADYLQASTTHSQVLEQEAAVQGLITEYEARLGVFWDPFALVYTTHQGEKVFNRMLIRSQNSLWRPSPLAVINQSLKLFRIKARGYNERLVQWIIFDTAKNLETSNRGSDKTDAQSNLLALRYTLDYLRRYKKIDTEIDRDGKKSEEKSDKKSKNKSKQESEENPPPEYPDLPSAYKPFTKDTPKSEGGKQEKQRVIEANFKTLYFAQRIFAEISRQASHVFQEVSLPMAQTAPGKFQSTVKKMIVRTFGKKEVVLFLPPGTRPLQPSDPRAKISRSPSGGYILNLSVDLPEIEIPLIEENNIDLMPHIKEIYLRAVGFDRSEWPDKIQASVFNKFSGKPSEYDALVVAKALAHHLSTEYLYSVGSRPETDPVDALRAGAFQCDMAAYAMVSILRDVFQIPSRVVGGYRAQKFKKDKSEKSYLTLPGEAHAWVEVYHSGQWHVFDPTPIKKDQKDEDENQDGKSEYEDQVDEAAVEQNQKQQTEQQQDEQEKDEQKPAAEKSKESANASEKKSDETDSESITHDELIAQLEIGSLELEPRLDRNALLERAIRVLLQNILVPTKTSLEITNELSKVSSLLKRFSSPSTKMIYQEALAAHEGEHPALKPWLERLLGVFQKQDVNKSYQDLHKIMQALVIYSRVLDMNGRVPLPGELLETLKNIRIEFDKVKHVDAKEIGIVQGLVKNLPSVARQLLKNKYDFTAVGPNSPTHTVAEKLKSGELNDLRLLSILSPQADFILSSSPRPETIEVRTWERDLNKTRGRDIMPLQRFSDMARALLGQPGLSVEENMRQGTAYLTTHRKRVDIPKVYGKEEAERVTIVLYDTSGSMSGDPGEFQAGLISAFTAKALSDLSPSGRHRHRVLIVPFDGETGVPVHVTNTAEALDVINNYQNKLKNTGGSTDIQKALMQAMSLIADAERRSGEPLAAANIILMTDGEAEIDTAKLFEARKAIDRQTPLQTMFVAINQTSAKLMDFAMGSQAMGADQGFYREFGADDIAKYLSQSRTLNMNDSENFYSDRKANELPPRIYQLLELAIRQAAQYTDQLYKARSFVSAREHLQEFEKVKWSHTKQVERPLEEWLMKVRQLVRQPIFDESDMRERVIDDILQNFTLLTGVEFGELSGHEQEHLRHLIRFAAGLEGEL